MATLKIQDALDKAKQNPNSDFASFIRKEIESGNMDAPAQKQGVDLSPFGRPKLQEKKSFLDRAGENIQERGENISQAISGTEEFEDRSIIGRGVGATAEAFGGFSSTAYEALPETAKNALDKVGGGIGKGFNFLTDKISDSQFLQEATRGDTSKLEEALKIVSDLGIISGEALGAGETAVVANVVKGGVQKGATAIGGQVSKIPLKVVSKVDDVRNVFRAKSLGDLPEQQIELTKNFRENIIGDKKTLNNKLDKLAQKQGTDSATLLKELIEEGGLPEVDGQTLNYQPFIDSLGREKQSVSTQINRKADQIVELTDINTFKAEALATVSNARASSSQLLSTNAKVEKIFKSFEKKYGQNLTGANINEIRVDMNKAFKANADRFEVDAQNSIGGASRRRLEELDPTITEGLAHNSKLNRVEGVASILKREKISVNEYVERMGGFAGVMLTGGLGISALAGGPAGLLIAGMGAQIGSKVLAKSLRKRAFSPERFNLIKASLDENPAILQKLINEADAADAALFERLQLPATTSDTIAIPPVERSNVKAVQAGKGIPEQGKTGKFEKRFSSTGEDVIPTSQ